MTLDKEDITGIIKSVLFEFPLHEVGIYLPAWVNARRWSVIKNELYTTIRKCLNSASRIKDVDAAFAAIGESNNVSLAAVRDMDLGRGVVTATLELPHELFYNTLSEQSGLEINDDGDLISLLSQLSKIKREYDRIDSALKVRSPAMALMRREVLEEPGSSAGAATASASRPAPLRSTCWPSIRNRVSAIGGEKSSEDFIASSCRVRGTWADLGIQHLVSPYDIASEGLSNKKRCQKKQMKLGKPSAHRQRRQRRIDLHYTVIYVINFPRVNDFRLTLGLFCSNSILKFP